MRKSYCLALATLLAGMLACSSSDQRGGETVADKNAGDGDASSGDGDTGSGSTGDGDTASGSKPGDDDTSSSSGDGDSGDGETGLGGGGGGDSSVASRDDDAGTALADGTWGTTGDWEIPDELLLCGDRACACANGLDDDGDGVADGFDAECTGANDDDEGTFATGIPGDNMDAKWQDCFFDGNSGAGDDGCRYHFECLTGERSQGDESCTVTQECVDFCLARTPNGCDCFGCCTFTKEGGETVNVVIGAGCSEETLDQCTTCQPTEGLCNNPCGECELCPGRTVEDLPDTCFETPTGDGDGDGDSTAGDGDGDSPTGDGDGDGGDPPFVCDGGETPCYATSDCEVGSYCSQGCCLLTGPQ
ncbi:MAG: hypothetical protein OXU20_03725 [Myxococcales bacterium]|nr:hypothetical protein [Myxococcales bacterium]